MAKAQTKAASVVPFDCSGRDYEPVPGDFVLKEYGADSELDTNFASQSWPLHDPLLLLGAVGGA